MCKTNPIGHLPRWDRRDRSCQTRRPRQKSPSGVPTRVSGPISQIDSVEPDFCRARQTKPIAPERLRRQVPFGKAVMTKFIGKWPRQNKANFTPMPIRRSAFPGAGRAKQSQLPTRPITPNEPNWPEQIMQNEPNSRLRRVGRGLGGRGTQGKCAKRSQFVPRVRKRARDGRPGAPLRGSIVQNEPNFGRAGWDGAWGTGAGMAGSSSGYGCEARRVAGILPACVEGVPPSKRGQDALGTRGRGRPRHVTSCATTLRSTILSPLAPGASDPSGEFPCLQRGMRLGWELRDRMVPG